MLFDFYPWQLDVDVDLTKQFYEEIDDLVDDTANMEFLKSLSLKQQYFFKTTIIFSFLRSRFNKSRCR